MEDSAPGGLIDRGEHVLLAAETSLAVLDNLAIQLTARRSRVLRPSTAGPLTLPRLLAQIVGRPPDEELAAADLERGFELLTESGPGCDQVVLLLDHADALDPAALRYLQLLAEESPLRLLLVGGPKLYALLMQDEFGALRRGFIMHAARWKESEPLVQAQSPEPISS